MLVKSKKPDVEEVMDAVGEGHRYWIDKNGEIFGLCEILQEWAVAQRNSLWKDHVDIIRRVDANKTINFIFLLLYHEFIVYITISQLSDYK